MHESGAALGEVVMRGRGSLGPLPTWPLLESHFLLLGSPRTLHFETPDLGERERVVKKVRFDLLYMLFYLYLLKFFKHIFLL